MPCKKDLGIIDLYCSNYCHLLSELSLKFQSSMTIIHYMYVRMQNIPKVGELKVN